MIPSATLITIRSAIACDLPTMLPLMARLGYEADLETLIKRFEQFTKPEGYGVAVAVSSGGVVSADHRGMGIGKKLMNFVEEFARQFGDVIIDLTSGRRREKDGSHEFYDALGYKNNGHMAKVYLRKELHKEL